MALSFEGEACIFRLTEIERAVRQTVDVASGAYPYRHCGPTHEHPPKRFARPRKLQKIHRFQMTENLGGIVSRFLVQSIAYMRTSYVTSNGSAHISFKTPRNALTFFGRAFATAFF